MLDKGRDIAILAIGNMVKHALEAKEILMKEGINPTIINARFLKPMDEELMHKLCEEHNHIVTVEDNVISGGFGSRINQFMVDNNYKIDVVNMAISEEFVPHGNVDKLYDFVGLSCEHIADKIKKINLERQFYEKENRRIISGTRPLR